MAALTGNVLTVDYLIDVLREDLDDPLLPGEGSSPDQDCLWSTDHLIRAIRLAQISAARDATDIQDVYVLPLVIDRAEYTLPDYVFEIRRIKDWPDETPIRVYDVFGQPVGESAQWRDDYGYDYGIAGPTMSEADVGTPRRATYDEKDQIIRVMPKPVAAGEWRVYIRRGPKYPIIDCASQLELRALKYEMALVARAKYELYNKHDAETYDANLRDRYLTMYLQEVDKLDQERKIKRGHIPVVRVPAIWG